jgi:hypothetical protein
MFALDGCKNLRSNPRHNKFPAAEIATAAPIRITTVRALVTIPIVVRATDKGEITQANLRASTFAQRAKFSAIERLKPAPNWKTYRRTIKTRARADEMVAQRDARPKL